MGLLRCRYSNTTAIASSVSWQGSALMANKSYSLPLDVLHDSRDGRGCKENPNMVSGRPIQNRTGGTARKEDGGRKGWRRTVADHSRGWPRRRTQKFPRKATASVSNTTKQLPIRMWRLLPPQRRILAIEGDSACIEVRLASAQIACAAEILVQISASPDSTKQDRHTNTNVRMTCGRRSEEAGNPQS